MRSTRTICSTPEKFCRSRRTRKAPKAHGNMARPPTALGFWLRGYWFGRETLAPIAIICFGFGLAALGLSPTIDTYCLPVSKQELSYQTGFLLETSRSTRMGGSFLVQFKDGPRSFSTDNAFTRKLDSFIGDEIVVGYTSGPFYCRSRALHIERAGEVLKDGDASINNRRNSRWFDAAMAVMLGLLASIPLTAGLRLLRKESAKLRAQNN